MNINKYFPKLIRAGLDKDERSIRSIALTLVRNFKVIDDNISKEIAKALDYNAIGSLAKRSVGINSSPVDMDSKSDLLNVDEPLKIERPIYNDEINDYIDGFLKERRNVNKLIEVGILPTSSILLYGPPGVGKTFLAKYLAGELNIQFASLNLSTVISSYLGKTGQNLKTVLDYARREPTILLLDEFDAIAKKRDDYSDLGELKRIVNVLLKELENWPYHSIIIAATNYPDLLDKAIWRRFDSTLEIGLPEENERYTILLKQMEFIEMKNKKSFLKIISKLLLNFSADDICKFIDKIKRKYILDNGEIEVIFLKELLSIKEFNSTDFNKKFCKLARENGNITLKQLSDMLGKSKSTIQYYLK